VEAIDLLLARRSVSKLVDPAPEGAALDRILRAALRAPDHGTLRPWKILLVRGEAREKLGAIWAEAMRRREPDVGEEELEREKRKALRSPLVAIVVAATRESPKAPEIEQILSAGCVAYGLAIAAQAEGFGAVWKTGDAAYDRWVHQELGLSASDKIVGVVYVGTPREEPPVANRASVADVVRDWNG
jgi:nitroreductase